MSERHIVVIGGGITGLVAAYRLRQLHSSGTMPIRCTLLEKSTRFGGKIETLRTGDYTLELGPDSIFTRKPAGVDFIREIGLAAAMVPVSPSGGTYVWHKGRLQLLPPGVNTGVPSDLSAFAKTRLLSIQGKVRALADLFLPFIPFPGDVSLGELLRRRLGDEVVDVIAAPLLAGIHAGDIDRLSLDATMPMWRKLYDDHRSLILGAMAVKNKTGAAPAGPIFINLQNGLGQLVEHVVEQVKDFADLRLETSALGVKKTQHGKYEVAIHTHGMDAILKADAVIVATPAPAAATILDGLGIQKLELLKSIRYAHTATVSFGYNKRPESYRMAGSGYLVPRNEGATITACTIVSTKWTNAVKNGNLLVRCYVGRDGDEEAVDWEDGRLVAVALQDLRKSIHLAEKPDFIKIMRWKNSMPQYDVGHLDKLRLIENELENHPSLALAGGAYRGIGIPDCITDATRAVEHVKAHLLH